jgi:ATP-binding cassette subfamily F protein uup
LVSHDRSFLNNVSTSTIVFDDDGEVREYVGGYDDWLHQREQDKQAIAAKQKATVKPVPKKAEPTKKKSTLTYQEQLDLEALPKQIEQLETKQTELHDEISKPEFYQQAAELVAKTQDQLATLEAELEQAYERWEILEEKQNG